MIQIQEIRYEAPPPTSYVLEATFPTDQAPPFRVEGFPTDWRLVVPANDDGLAVWEVSSLVPAGTTQAQVSRGSVPGPGLPLQPYIFNPDSLVLRVDGLWIPLTDRQYFTGWHRRGRVHATATFHRSLGAFGHAEYWISARAGVPQLDVTLLWHRAIPGPDFRFFDARLASPADIQEVEYDDPGLSATAPAGSVADGAIQSGIVPQQFARVFRFSLVYPGQQGQREHKGTADWTHGGYLPSGLPVPKVAGIDYAPALVTERARLAACAPTPDYGAQPASQLWPAAGVTSGGEGGSDDHFVLDGSRWSASYGDAEVYRWYLIHQLRNLCRSRIRLGDNGRHMTLPSWGSWQYWDGFLNGQDAPWNWDAWPPLSSPGDPRRFNSYDTATMLRAANEQWTLVWLANDPLAKLLALEIATRGRMTFWEGPGPAHRLDVPPLDQEGLGSDIGAWQAVSGLCIAAARALGDTQYEAWTAAYLGHLRRVQMPNGCFVAREGGYPADREPFFGQYRLQGGAEFAYHILAAYSLGDRDLARSAMRGLQGLQTDDDPGPVGNYYFTVTGLAGTDERYWNEWFWPADLWPQMGQPWPNGSYYVAFDLAVEVAIAWKTDAPEKHELLRRFLGTTDPVQGAATLRSWGLTAPATHGDVPFEQTNALLGVLENN